VPTLADRTALATGAGSGLGFEAAAQSAESGYGRVIITEREESEVAAQSGPQSRAAADVFEPLAMGLLGTLTSDPSRSPSPDPRPPGQCADLNTIGIEAVDFGSDETGTFFASRPKKMTGPPHEIEMTIWTTRTCNGHRGTQRHGCPAMSATRLIRRVDDSAATIRLGFSAETLAI
jgi:hypothetical protein